MTTSTLAKSRSDDDGDAQARAQFRRDVLTGLSQTQKTVPPKYFYDRVGARLFERICALPEYYPTRTEMRILRQAAPAIAQRIGADAALVEFGSGASEKVHILLDALERPGAYVPIDICGPQLRAVSAALKRAYPRVEIVPVEADFSRRVDLPPVTCGRRRLGFFPGSTIGNLSPQEAEAFLRRAHETLGAEADFLVGVDLEKSETLLHAAYNDTAGITAQFNLNVLARINRELGGTFDLAGFRHRAVYNAEYRRVEMHLESLRPQTVRVADRSFAFRTGETIHTENSHKYSVAEFRALAQQAGWHAAETFVDPDGLFSVHCLSGKAAIL